MENLTIDEKIEICKQTRQYAAEALLKVLQMTLKNNMKHSESELRDMRKDELRKNKDILEDGYYSPPPYGASIVIGNDDDGVENRLNFLSLRHEEIRPQDNTYLNTKNGMMYAYCSPVDKTGIIGDFGITLYFGKDQEIIDHITKCYGINQEIFNNITPGISFPQISKHAEQLIKENGLSNDIECKTSPLNIGHTIPFTIEGDETIETPLENIDHDKIKTMICENRRFIDPNSSQVVKNGMIFTIEPRLRSINNLKIPMVSTHTICAIKENGQKELITNFDEIFNLVGVE